MLEGCDNVSIYITGDTHGSFKRIKDFIDKFHITKDDVIVILGDVGINYFGTEQEYKAKQIYNSFGPTILSLQGNHEERPYNIVGYKTKEWNNGIVYFQEEFPNLLFAKDGEIYNLNEKQCMCIGGAYSVDKWYRIVRCYLNYEPLLSEKLDIEEYEKALLFVQGKITDSDESIRKRLMEVYNTFPQGICTWFKDEQPSDEIKSYVEEQILKNKIDVVFSHTCPTKYTPVEMFLDFINQDSVDHSTEEWLDKIEDNLDYEKWYCGHWHTNKKIDKMVFLFEDFVEL